MKKSNIANLITFAGWFVVIMFFIVTNAFGVMFEASMLFILVVSGVGALGIILFILLLIIPGVRK